MQERALAPWGNVEEVRSSKRISDKKENNGLEKKYDIRSNDGHRTIRGDRDKHAESKSKSSSRRTSVAAASKIYSNGKTKDSSSKLTSQTTTGSSVVKASSSSHAGKSKTITSNGALGSERVRIAKEKEQLKNEIKKSKNGDRNINIEPRQKEEEKAKSKVRESRSGNSAAQAIHDAEKRPRTSGKSRGNATTQHIPSLPPAKELRRPGGDKSEVKLTTGTRRNSKMRISDRLETAYVNERGDTDLSNAKLSANPRDSVSHNHDIGALLPNKKSDKPSSAEKLANGYDAAASGGRSSRAGSARSSRSRGTSGSEVESYSDDFSSYGSDFDSDVGDDSGEGTAISSPSDEEIELKSNRRRSPNRAPFENIEQPATQRLRFDQTASKTIAPNGEKKTSASTRAQEILSFVHLDRSKHLALHFEGLKYESYMAAFGARNRRQEAVQTMECVDEECQTEPGLNRDIWTQHPAKGVQGAVMGAGVGMAHVVDVLALSRFVQSAAAVVLELLEENFDVPVRRSTNSLSTSGGIGGLSVAQINLPLHDSLPVIAVASAPSKHFRLACVFGMHRRENEDGPMSALGFWDSREPARPKELLTCRSSPQRVIWLGDEIIVATLDDSSLAAWDLRRTTASLTPNAGFVKWGGVMIPKRAAAFSSALADAELCQIVGLCSLTAKRGDFNDDEEETSVVTLDFEGHLVFWSLYQIQETDNALEDLVVAPQSMIKLVRSAGVKLSLNNVQFTCLAVIDLELFAGKDDGGVLHLSRHAAPKFPKTYASRPTGIDVVEAPSEAVTCLCGIGRHLVVASGTTNTSSTLRIFDRVSAYPLRTVTHWAPVTSIVSSSFHTEGNAMALLVNTDHQLCRLDLFSADIQPLYENVQCLSVHKTPDMNLLVIGRVDGAIEVHTLS